MNVCRGRQSKVEDVLLMWLEHLEPGRRRWVGTERKKDRRCDDIEQCWILCIGRFGWMSFMITSGFQKKRKRHIENAVASRENDEKILYISRERKKEREIVEMRRNKKRVNSRMPASYALFHHKGRRKRRKEREWQSTAISNS